MCGRNGCASVLALPGAQHEKIITMEHERFLIARGIRRPCQPLRRDRRAIRLLACAFALASAILPTAKALTVIPPTFDQLVGESGAIVRAKVLSAESYRTTSPNGQAAIKTRVVWQVAQTLKGASEQTLELDFLGGRVGDETLEIPGVPQFRPGDEDFLFVEANRAVFCPVLRVGFGRYRVMHDTASGREYVARSNGVPLTDLAQIPDPLDGRRSGDFSTLAERAFSPDAFAMAIRDAVRNTGGSSEK